MKKTLVAIALAGAVAQAQASTLTSFLTISDPAASLGAGPYARVDITQGIDANTVDVVETFLTPYYMVFTGGPHHALTWNISGSETISIAGAPSGFSLYAPATNSPFGQFEYGINCAGCTKGALGAMPGPLSFSIISSVALDPTKFGVNLNGYLFSSDVINTQTGATANVAAPVPEPETYALMLAGLGLMGLLARRRKHDHLDVSPNGLLHCRCCANSICSTG